MNFATAILFVVSAAISLTQAKPQRAKNSAQSEADEQNVYSQSWDAGEIKHCETYSGQPYLLICDADKMDWKESFINLIGDYAASGLSHDESYHRAFVYCVTHSKEFSASFSEEPWPKPRAGLELTMWKCTKDKTISCKLIGREKPKSN